MKPVLIAVFIIIVCTVQSQTLFTVGKNNISKEEFLRAYNKNKSGESNIEKDYRDYLDLYVRFKLKVQAAYDAKLDTLTTQKEELVNFRNQIAESFMNDENSLQLLIDEAFVRSQKDIRLSHIYIAFTGTDTAAAYKKAMEAYTKLQNGADFITVAEAYSEDTAVNTNKGDIGYITSFILPYELETLAYNTAVGKTSKLFKSKTAYHIFKNTAERPSAGKIKAAHILLAFKPDADDKEKATIKKLADSLYNLLQKGASFKNMATKYSNDNISYQSGGLLPEFGVGKYNADFENEAFALAKDGDISKPFLTSYGYHILQRVERTPIATDKTNATAIAQIKQNVQTDNRIQISKQIFVQKIMKLCGYKKAVYSEKPVLAHIDSVYNDKKARVSPLANNKTLLFSFPEKNVFIADIVKYINSIKAAQEITHLNSPQQLLQQYTEYMSYDYYRNHLEQFNKEFSYQLKEFKDGNLLFEIMQRQVWDKAATDTVGLKTYYNNNKNKYWWEASVDVILFNVNDSTLATAARDNYIKNPTDWKMLIQNSDGVVQADSGRFEMAQLPLLSSNNTIRPGFISEPVKSTTDNMSTFMVVKKVYTDRSPRNFEDAKGFVINDYQSFLEQKWIDGLMKKNPVKINEPILQSCWK